MHLYTDTVKLDRLIAYAHMDAQTFRINVAMSGSMFGISRWLRFVSALAPPPVHPSCGQHANLDVTLLP